MLDPNPTVQKTKPTIPPQPCHCQWTLKQVVLPHVNYSCWGALSERMKIPHSATSGSSYPLVYTTVSLQ